MLTAGRLKDTLLHLILNFESNFELNQNQKNFLAKRAKPCRQLSRRLGYSHPAIARAQGARQERQIILDFKTKIKAFSLRPPALAQSLGAGTLNAAKSQRQGFAGLARDAFDYSFGFVFSV
jgi:hypothetical protein